MRQVTIRFELPETEHRELKLLVAHRRTTMREWIVRLVRESLAAADPNPSAAGSHQRSSVGD